MKHGKLIVTKNSGSIWSMEMRPSKSVKKKSL